MESESMAENKTNNVKRVRKSRWGPELPLPHTTDKADEVVHESSNKNDLPVLPNGTNDEPVGKEGGSANITLTQEHNDSCKNIEKKTLDIKQEIANEIQMKVSPPCSPVEIKLELKTPDINHETQEVSNSETGVNNSLLTQDLNSEAPNFETPEKSQKEKAGIVNSESARGINVKPLQDLIKPVQLTETQPVILSQDLHSVASECTANNVISDLNSESENIKSRENTVLINKEIQQESPEDKAHDTTYFYGFDSVTDKYNKFLKVLESIRINAKVQKCVELEQIKTCISERKNRQREKILERGLKKEKLLDTSNESDGVETVHDMEVESTDSIHETEGESLDMLHETESERLKGKLSEDEFMKNDYERISRREIESSKISDISNENFKTEENFKHSFTDAEINFTHDETKDSDIESDKTDERNGIKGNIDDGSTLSRPTKKSRTSVKKPVYFDVSNPAYLKPFDYGWKRELVFRSTNEGSNKRNSDVYYYTPKGKKVRSFREVIENLTDNELTVDNFTFFKEPLGVEPDKEIIRDAKIKVTKESNTTSPVEKKIPKVPAKPKKSLSKKVSPPVTPSHENAPTNQTSQVQAPTPPKVSLTPKVVLKGAKPKLSSGPKFKVTPSRNGVPGQIQKAYSKEKKRKMSEDELEMGMLPPMWQPHDKLNPKLRDKENSNKAVPVSSGASGKSMEVCSIRCPLAMGLIPTLQCHVCLCLYHPECVGIKEALNRTIHSYKCKNCQNDSKAQKPSTNTSKNNSNSLRLPLSLSPPPLTPISTLSSASTNSVHPAPCSPPKLQRLQDGKVVTVPCSMTKPITKTQSIVGGVTTWLPPSSTIQLSPTVKLSPSVKTSLPVTTTVVDSTSATLPSQSLVTMNNKRYVIVPKHNILSVSPATTSSVHIADPSIPQSTVATSDQGVTITPSLTSVVTQTYGPGSPVLPKPIPTSAATFLVSSPATPSTTFQNPPGVLLVPYIPPQSPNQPSLRDGQQPPPPQQYVIVNGTGLPTGNLIFGNIPQQQTPIKLPAIPTSQAAEPSSESASVKRLAIDQAEDSPPSKKIKKDAEIPNRMQYFMMDLSAGYLALLHAFQYLKVHELLRASRVCHMWRDIAMHKTLWETVKMKNSRVRDWEGFAQTLKKVGTRHLDLRKMLVPDTQEALHTMWMEFSKAIAKVNSLRRLDLCKCSSRLIEQVAVACPQLEGLSAHTIRSSHLNLNCLERCKNLTDLRLKGASNSIEVSNIMSLKSLNKLRFLSLTSVQNLSEDIVVVLENLPHLESLELGECDRLPNKFVTESLPKLTKLKRLRLEKGTGPDCPTISLLETISKCSQMTQLELVNFDIKQGFDTALGLCTNIKTLLIIPTYITQSATTNHLVMEGVSKLSKTLTHFVWGLTLELLRVTDLFIDQWEVQRSGTKPQASGKRPGSGDSIPILKPDKSAVKKDGGTPLQVDVLQLPKLHKVLTTLLPITKIRILKVPFIATWRQTVTGATQ